MAERLQTIAGHLKAAPNACDIIFNATSTQTSQHSSGSFKFTIDSSVLSIEQRKFYEENGFLVIKKLVSPAKLDLYRKRFETICKEKIVVPGMTAMKDVAIETSEYVPGEKAIAKVQDFQNDDTLFEYCSLPEVVKYVEAIVGLDLMAIHTMFINKPPDPGNMTSRHPMHQDLHYFPFRPSNQIVCSWTAMQKVNRQNGCLVVVPGSHKGELLPHEYPNWEGGVNKMYHGIQNYDPSQERVYLEMDEGDTVFFHPILIHGSGSNKSNGFRKSISCHYANSKCFVEDVTEGSQKIIVDETREIFKRRFGKNLEDANIQFHGPLTFKPGPAPCPIPRPWLEHYSQTYIVVFGIKRIQYNSNPTNS